MKLSVLVAGLAGIAILSFGNRASAQVVIYNNLPDTSAGIDPLAMDGPDADSFSTGPGFSNLSQVTLALALTGSPTGSIDVSLLSDSSTSPGAVIADLGTLSDSALSGTIGDFNFSPASTVTLTPDTRYWIQVTGSSSTAAWSYGVDNSGIGTAGEYWAYYPSGGPLTVTANSNAESAYQMEIGVTAVPEPGAYALLATLGLTGVGLLRRRRRAR